MYYDEGIINGILCHKGTPDGPWIPFTVEQLTERLVRVEKERSKLQFQLEEINETGSYTVGFFDL